MSAAYYEPSGLNKFWLGLLLGLGFPLVFFMLYFLFRFRDLSFNDYIHILIQTGKYVHVISLAVFSNLIPFMFFVRTNRFKSGRGVMAITILFVVSVFVMKFAM
ncbi:MAG: hypothetical protein NTZ69_17600 [Bacteroidia bacterium]|nr:hypothetical protein [Bacteroidia bacterium]